MSAILEPEACAIDDRRLTVALVNNMPDSAFVETEDQFRRCATAGTNGDSVDLELYTITEIPRSEGITDVIQSRYGGLDQLWANPPDALIVTGTEPAKVDLQNEPFWPYMARLLEWAAVSVPTTLLSCLASHVSTLLFDGIDRVRRPSKCSGVFLGVVEDPCDPLAIDLPELVPMPHSRLNEVPQNALADAGYRIVIGSGPSHAGWTVAAREHRDGLFVLCQGHPEYGTLSLLREYRRDVRRCLFGHGSASYPRLPEGYLRPEAMTRLEEFARRADSAPDADPLELWASFPYKDVAASVENTWAASSAVVYANWLRLARAAKPARV